MHSPQYIDHPTSACLALAQPIAERQGKAMQCNCPSQIIKSPGISSFSHSSRKICTSIIEAKTDSLVSFAC